MIDGTHSPVQRPSEKTVRRMRYSGKVTVNVLPKFSMVFLVRCSIHA